MDQELIENNPVTQAQVTPTKRPNSLLIVIFSVFGTCAVILCGFFIYKLMLNKEPTQDVSVVTTKPEDVKKEESRIEWLTYFNDEYKFTLKYPTNYRLEDAKFEYSPFYPFDEKNVLNIEITRDVYVHKAQNPLIRLAIFKTDKLVSDVILDLKASNTKNIEDLQDPNNPFYGATVSLPEILSQKDVTIGGVSAVEIDRFGGPGAPNVDYLEYYFTHDGYLYVLKANWERHGENTLESGYIEVTDLKKIIETFEFKN